MDPQEIPLDFELIDGIEAQVKRAHWPKVVARRMGIQPKTFDAWMARGAAASKADVGFKPDDPEFAYRQLFERIEEAEAIAEMHLLDMAQEQAALGKTSWNGFLQTLERRFGDRWGRRDPGLGYATDGLEGAIKRHLDEQQAANPADEPRRLRPIA